MMLYNMFFNGDSVIFFVVLEEKMIAPIWRYDK